MSEDPAQDAAAEFFHEIVAPTVAAFLTAYDDKRLGCLACLVLASMSDHFFHARPDAVREHKDADAFRRSLSSKHWGVGVVIGVANATKHVVRRSGRVGFNDIQAQNIACGNLRAGWSINGRQVMVETAPGDLWLLSDLVEGAKDFWQEKLGLIPRAPSNDAG